MNMNLFQYVLILLVPLLGVNLYATLAELDLLMQVSQLLFIPGILGIYLKQVKKPDFNAVIFISLFFIAQMNEIFEKSENLSLASLFLFIGSYIFLSREAIRNTERETASKRMLLYFVLLVLVIFYLLLTHVIEIKTYTSSTIEFAGYIIYYLNLLILGIISLIYYLNSYSKKSVYFITLVLAFIFADVFRDTANFYIKDSAILITGNLLWFTGLSFSLLFFLTPERKLRLMNLI